MAVISLNLNFNLRSISCAGNTPINLIIRYNGKRITYPTGENVNPRNWQGDKKKKGYQRAKPNSFNDYSELNSRLDNIENTVAEVFRKYRNDNEHKAPTIKILKQLLDIEFKRTSQPVRILIPFIKKFIEDSKTRKNHKTGKAISPHTLKKYQTTLNHLQAFIKKTNDNIDFEDINTDFRREYIHFLSSYYDLSVNSIGKDIVVLKTFLNASTEIGINKHLHFKSPNFTALSEKADSIYLNEQEIDLIYSLDLSNNPTLESVRDLFMIGCYTGLQYSDYNNINNNNIINNRLVIDTYKTGATVIIPLHRIVKAIFTKYSGNLPRCFSNQKTNQYLKETGEKVDALKEIVEKKSRKVVFVRF
ncbi:MAG TPA: site-specific integrase [Flavisolibacter sp.]|nr:site-specific integrase [Flavisolibacter sp.]